MAANTGFDLKKFTKENPTVAAGGFALLGFLAFNMVEDSIQPSPEQKAKMNWASTLGCKLLSWAPLLGAVAIFFGAQAHANGGNFLDGAASPFKSAFDAVKDITGFTPSPQEQLQANLKRAKVNEFVEQGKSTNDYYNFISPTNNTFLDWVNHGHAEEFRNLNGANAKPTEYKAFKDQFLDSLNEDDRNAFNDKYVQARQGQFDAFARPQVPVSPATRHTP